jgi:mitochondrial enoyl-[acyl-carrier protein] reductase / trans-2-enoyl-CoA reductase
MITYGGMSKQPVIIPTSLLIFKNIRVQGFWLSKWLDDHPVERLQMLEELCCLVRDGALSFQLEKYALEDYQTALKRSLTEKKPHKVVFIMP